MVMAHEELIAEAQQEAEDTPQEIQDGQLDRRRPFAEVLGHSSVKYRQDNKFYDHRGLPVDGPYMELKEGVKIFLESNDITTAWWTEGAELPADLLVLVRKIPYACILRPSGPLSTQEEKFQKEWEKAGGKLILARELADLAAGLGITLED